MANTQKLTNYIKNFNEVQGREPSRDEIIDHFDDILSENELNDVLNTYDSKKSDGIKINVEMASVVT